MSIIVTGGAGFIGSCVVKTLNNMGIEDIIIVDNIASTDKWINLRNKKYSKYVHKTELIETLRKESNIEIIIHMGACSATTERDFDYLWKNNFEYTKALWEYCKEHKVRFIYASSAATYGDGSHGFDDEMDIDNLLPLNCYGYSKQAFDQWVNTQTLFPDQHVGLKFFNVYGPNEYNKGSMASMIYHGYRQIKNDSEIRLFKSYNPQYLDGEQLRDFIYVKDVCSVIRYFLEHPKKSGLFNVGTGKSQSFKQLAEAIFQALRMEPDIVYIDMPNHLREKYQYFTEAKIDKLRDAGYDRPFWDLNAGVRDYVGNYLDQGFQVY